jgi:hypothetical protein
LNIIWNIIIKFAFLLNLYTLLISQSQVYAINSISYLIFSKLVRPLMVLSLNSPKPTKGLDALIAFLICLLHSQWFLLIWHQWDSVWCSDFSTVHSNFTVY